MRTSNRNRSRGERRRSNVDAEYDAWAPYYDLIHRGLDGEAEFYVNQALRRGGKTLELGCGTGRIAILMAMSGADVTGLDNSRAMLRICREKLRAVGKIPGRLRVHRADMRDFSLPDRFRLVAMPYRTFMHLLTPDDQRRCLECVHRHLEDGGVVVLNMWRPTAVHLAPLLESRGGIMQFAGTHKLPDDSAELIHFCATVCDELHQTLSERHFLHEKSDEAEVLRTVRLSMERAWTTPREMEHLARSCGFEPEACFGDFDCNPLDYDSSEQIWVLRKAL